MLPKEQATNCHAILPIAQPWEATDPSSISCEMHWHVGIFPLGAAPGISHCTGLFPHLCSAWALAQVAWCPLARGVRRGHTWLSAQRCGT